MGRFSRLITKVHIFSALIYSEIAMVLWLLLFIAGLLIVSKHRLVGILLCAPFVLIYGTGIISISRSKKRNKKAREYFMREIFPRLEKGEKDFTCPRCHQKVIVVAENENHVTCAGCGCSDQWFYKELE